MTRLPFLHFTPTGEYPNPAILKGVLAEIARDKHAKRIHLQRAHIEATNRKLEALVHG